MRGCSAFKDKLLEHFEPEHCAQQKARDRGRGRERSRSRERDPEVCFLNLFEHESECVERERFRCFRRCITCEQV